MSSMVQSQRPRRRRITMRAVRLYLDDRVDEISNLPQGSLVKASQYEEARLALRGRQRGKALEIIREEIRSAEKKIEFLREMEASLVN